MRDSKIKDSPELRHVLSHMVLAIQEIALGNSETALYELETLDSMINWTSEDEYESFCERRCEAMYEKKKRVRKPGGCTGK